MPLLALSQEDPHTHAARLVSHYHLQQPTQIAGGVEFWQN